MMNVLYYYACEAFPRAPRSRQVQQLTETCTSLTKGLELQFGDVNIVAIPTVGPARVELIPNPIHPIYVTHEKQTEKDNE